MHLPAPDPDAAEMLAMAETFDDYAELLKTPNTTVLNLAVLGNDFRNWSRLVKCYLLTEKAPTNPPLTLTDDDLRTFGPAALQAAATLYATHHHEHYGALEVARHAVKLIEEFLNAKR